MALERFRTDKIIKLWNVQPHRQLSYLCVGYAYQWLGMITTWNLQNQQQYTSEYQLLWWGNKADKQQGHILAFLPCLKTQSI